MRTAQSIVLIVLQQGGFASSYFLQSVYRRFARAVGAAVIDNDDFGKTALNVWRELRQNAGDLRRAIIGWNKNHHAHCAAI